MTVELAWAIFLSLGPGLFWLWYLYGHDRHHPQPVWVLGVVFLLGALAGQGVLSTAELTGVQGVPDDPWGALLYFVVYVGLVEELWKFLSVRLTVYYSPTFDEPMDGLLFAGCAALGFATAENTVYILRHEPTILLGRWILSTFGHVLLALFWGYAVGLQKVGAAGWGRVLLGLGLSGLAHGVYDWFLSTAGWEWFGVAMIAVLWSMFVGRIRDAHRHSPYRRSRAHPVVECGSCRSLVRHEAAWCTACGQKLPEGAASWCPNCLTVAGEAERCGGCGSVLV